MWQTPLYEAMAIAVEYGTTIVQDAAVMMSSTVAKKDEILHLALMVLGLMDPRGYGLDLPADFIYQTYA